MTGLQQQAVSLGVLTTLAALALLLYPAALMPEPVEVSHRYRATTKWF